MLQVHFIPPLLLAFLLFAPPALAQPADRCDSLYTAAQSGPHEAVLSGKGELRTTPEEKRAWRQTVQRLVRAAEEVRACYAPVLPPTDEPAASDGVPVDDATLPTPSSLVRQRVMDTYDWAVLAHRELQQYDAAFQQYDAFFDRFAPAADSSSVAFMYNSRGYLHYTLGNLTASVNDYVRTIAHTPAADTLDRANLMVDLGTILQAMGDGGTAQEYYGEAERLARTAAPSGYRRTILSRSLFNRGDLLKNRRPGETEAEQIARYDQAIALLLRALDTFSESQYVRRARTHIVLADAYRVVGDYEAAFRHIEQGRDLAASYVSRESSQAEVLALAALVRGQVEFAVGRLAEAAATLADGLQLAEAGDDRTRRYRILQELGEVAEADGEPVRAETYYRQAIAATNELRASLRATEWAAYTSDEWSAPHRGLVRALMAQNRPTEAFLALDYSRARHLQDRQLQTRLTSTLPPRERVRYDSLTTELASVRSNLTTDTLTTDRRVRLEQDEVRLMAARRSLLDLAPTASLASVSTLQSQLRAEQRALIAYYIGEPQTGGAAPSHAFVVTPNAFRAVPLRISGDTLLTRLMAVSPLLGGTPPPGLSRDAVNFDLKVLHRLYTELVAPAIDGVPPNLALTVIPDGPLFRLPFSMLVTEPPGMALYGDAPYLLRKRPLSMELSASLMRDTSWTARPFPLDIAALGRTRFETVPPLPPALRSRLDSTGALPALPGVERELDAVRQRFARHRVAVNDQATEGRLRALQPQARILHLASHALVHPADPLANLFVLSPDPPNEGANDGLLFVHELGARHAPVPLVVLTGCRTARGLMRTGEGPKGLQYAFRSTGARSTLSTLWDADDDIAVLLTSAFYDHLLKGLPKDVALQQAQLDVLDQRPDRASPFFWAGAVLYGTPRSLALKPASPIPLLPVAAGGFVLLLIALGFGYSRYRRHQS